LAIANYSEEQIVPRFVKKDFREFSYLHVEPPGWTVALSWAIILLVNAGVAWWIVANEFHDGRRSRFRLYS
jgi:hypothetical protein